MVNKFIENDAIGKDSIKRAISAAKNLTKGEKDFEVKDINPKDAVGTGKVPMSCVPAPVLMELALAMLEGSRKYGRHNYRVSGVRASVYYDAVMRHCMAWWEGEDIVSDSQLSHITKAIAGLVVIRDSMMTNTWVDDRPPIKHEFYWVQQMNKKAKEINNQYPEPKEAFTK